MEIVNNLIKSIMDFYHFFISGLSIDSAIKFGVIYFFVMWGAFIIWIVKDITNRTTNILLQTVSILLVIIFTPIFGLPIYLLIRPRSTIFEKYYESGEFEDDEIEVEEEVKEDDEKYSCPKCGKEVSSEFKFCPYCEFKLVKSCSKCSKELRSDWKVCPYCGNHDIAEKKETKKAEIKVEVEKIAKKKGVKEIIEKLEIEE